MEEPNLSSRLVDIESMLDRSRRRFEEGVKLVEEAHRQLSEIQQALIGSPRTVSPEDSEEAASKLLAYARNNVVTRQMLLKHLYRRSDDQPQPKIIDVFISKLRKKLRNASGGAEFVETIPQRGWILRDIEAGSGA